MTLKHCKTCRFWDPEDHDFYDVVIHDELPKGWGICRITDPDDAIHDERPSAYDPSLMQTHSSDEYYREPLHTSPEFGCIQWEPSAGTPSGASESTDSA